MQTGVSTQAIFLLGFFIFLIGYCPPSTAQSAGQVDLGFDPPTQAKDVIRAILIEPDGKITTAGRRSETETDPDGNTTTVYYGLVARYRLDGSTDNTFTNGNRGQGASGQVPQISAAARLLDGGYIMGGQFTFVDSQSQPYLARLDASGALVNEAFVKPGANQYVNALAVDGLGHVLAGGSFTVAGLQPRNFMARLQTNGAVDLSFTTEKGGPDNKVWAVAVQSDNKVLIGGDFTAVDGVARRGLARLNLDGSLDPTFDAGPGADGSVQAILVEPDDRILVGGAFTAYNGVACGRIARLQANGALDPSFNAGTGANNIIYALARQSDGRILAGGKFTAFNETSLSRIARLNSDGSVDATFNPGAGANQDVRALGVQRDGKILAGGNFSLFDNRVRNGLVQLQGGTTNAVSGPLITTHPQSRTVLTNSVVAFSAVLEGSPPFAYQWRKDGIDLPGETNATLTLLASAAVDGGYTLRVSNEHGSAESLPATLKSFVTPALQITQTNHQAALSLAGTAGLLHEVEYTDNLSITNAWQVLTNLTLPQTNAPLPALGALTVTNNALFFRSRVIP